MCIVLAVGWGWASLVHAAPRVPSIDPRAYTGPMEEAEPEELPEPDGTEADEIEPDATTETSEPGETAETSEPDATTETSEPDETSEADETSEPDATTEISEPDETSEPDATSEPTETTATSGPDATPRVTTRPRLRPGTISPPAEPIAPPPEPFRSVRIRLGLDLAITVGAGAPGLALGLWVSPSLPGPIAQPGPESDVGRFDRVALGRFARAPNTASNVLLPLSIAAPFAYHGIEAALHRRGFSRVRGRGFFLRYGTDLVLLGQTLAINALLTEILKASIRRPRPFTYLDPEDVDPALREQLVEAQAATGADWSFPSGHTSTAFAVSTAGATLLTLEQLGTNNWAVAVAWVGGTGVAATTGVMRVLAGRHFPSDVVTSALLGSAVGTVVPLAHWRRARSGDIGRRERMRRWTVAPLTGDGTTGLQIRGMFR